MKVRLLQILLCCFVSSPASAGELLSVGFEDSSPGIYDAQQAESDWPGLVWESLDHQRAAVVTDPEDSENQVLQVTYPAGKYRSEDSGAQFLVKLPDAYDACELTYRFRLAPDFEWTRGGKLPGLTSSGSDFTGGTKADGTGWSARYMWRPEGRCVVYLYHLDQPKDYGEDLTLESVTLKTGVWHTIRQEIQINTGSKADGVLKVWLDDQLVLERKDLRLRKAPDGRIDHFYFSTFYGGSTKSYAPEKTQQIWFDDFVIRSINP